MLAEFWPPSMSTSTPATTNTTTTAFTLVLPTHCCGHTNKAANGVTELCSLWSKNIHSTWYQQFKSFAACKGVVFEFAHNLHRRKSSSSIHQPSHTSQDTTLRTLLKEWIQSALYILVKHNHKFMEGLGEYATVQGNPALRATNRFGECIFLMVDRILVDLVRGIVLTIKKMHGQHDFVKPQ